MDEMDEEGYMVFVYGRLMVIKKQLKVMKLINTFAVRGLETFFGE